MCVIIIQAYQQMVDSGEFSIVKLLSTIKSILKNQCSKEADKYYVNPKHIVDLQQKISQIELTAQKMVSLMINDQYHEKSLKTYLLSVLLEKKRKEEVKKAYEQFKKQQIISYTISPENGGRLYKEAYLAIKLIKNQISLLPISLMDDAIVNTRLQPSLEPFLKDFSLFYLIRFAMADPIIEFSQKIQELLLRIYIIVESLQLLFMKLQTIFEQIIQKANIQEEKGQNQDTLSESRKSYDPTERSALSHSLKIYKKNLKLQQEEKKPLRRFLSDNNNQIQSDYVMIKKEETKISKIKSVLFCCARY